MKYITVEKLNTFAVKLWAKISSTFVRQSIFDQKANVNSPVFTGVPKAPTAGSGTNTTQLATTEFVQTAINSVLTASDAMVFKGTIGVGGTISALPDIHQVGDTYKVAVAGVYAGVNCEIGDMIICVTSGQSANNAHWSIVQNNIDGAVTISQASVVNNTVALFDGTTGKIIKSSGMTIGVSVPEDAKFTDTTYGEASISNEGLMSAEDKVKLDGIASNANKYVHPSYNAVNSGFYKVTVDSIGHISAVVAVTKADITNLGIPSQDTTYSIASASTDGLMSAADKAKLDDLITISEQGGYTHPTYTPRSNGLYKITVDVQGHVSDVSLVTKDDITNLGIPGQDTNTTYGVVTTSASGLMSASDKAKLDGIASGANVNTITGVKGNAESSYRTGQVNLTPANIGAAASSHTHSYAGSSSAGGVATSAAKLSSARTLTVGSTGKSFDGSANVAWTLAEIGVEEETTDNIDKIIAGTYS